MATPQTPRRSRRFQPLATPYLQQQTTKTECTWEGEPIHTRPCNPELDLLPEEREEREYAEEETSEDQRPEEETVFYTKCSLTRPKAKQARVKQAAGGQDTLTLRLGDTITVETDTLSRQRRPPSVAVIVSMWEVKQKGVDEPEQTASRMRLRVHWFLRPSELPAIREKREHKDNEIYYTLASSDILVPSVIVSRCTVSGRTPAVNSDKGKSRTNANRSTGKTGTNSKALEPRPDSDHDDDKPTDTFCCYYAIHSQRGLYYNFDWDHHRSAALKAASEIPGDATAQATWGSGEKWKVDTTESVTHQPKKRTGPPPKKRPKLEEEALESSDEDVDSGSEAEIESEPEDDDEMSDVAESEQDEGDDDDDFDVLEPRTPSKKRKRGQAGPKTPKRGRAGLAQPTPHSKRAIKERRKRKAAVNGSPRKRKLGKVPLREPKLSFETNLKHLPPDPWLRAMHVLHVGNRPEALPCRGEEYSRVFQCVEELLEEGSGGCIYISGVPGTGKTATVHSVIKEMKRLAEANEINPFTYVEINGLRISEPSAAYPILWAAISKQEGGKTDQHLSSNQSLKLLNQYFTRTTRGPAEHAYVVLMDELDQMLTAKQDVIYNFFNWPTLAGSRLIVLAVSNTMDLPQRVMTGRVRSRLGMTRVDFASYKTNQLVQIVQARLATIKEGLDEADAEREVMTEDAIKLIAMNVCRITGDARRVLDACRRLAELVSPTKTTAKPNHATQVIKEMKSSPRAGYLRECSLHERIMLAALIRCMRREGVEEIKWSDVQYQHLNFIGALTGSSDSQRKPSVAELTAVLDSLVASRAVRAEDAHSAARKPVGERRVVLNIEQIEVERVLSEEGGQVWTNVLSS